jgi:hypothetical protein
LPEGCFAEAPLDAVPAELLSVVLQDCQLGPHSIESEMGALRLAGNEPATLPFELPAPACVRWVAAGSRDVKDIEMTLLDASKTEVGSDELVGNLAVLGTHGPLCLKAGNYALSLRTVDGAGQVLVRGFSSHSSMRRLPR